MALYRHGILGAVVVAAVTWAAPVAADEPQPVTVAHIRLAGSFDEAPVTSDPIFGLGAENFKTKLDRIRKAQSDPAVKALYLQLDGLDIGWGKLDELRRAVTDVRAAGKKTVAYLDNGSTMDYLMALACDEVCMPESGWLLLTGLRGEMLFFKDLLDKIGVRADMLQMGDFKGAAEPFTRSSMSPQLRQQLEGLFDDYFEKGMVEAIVQGRSGKGLTAAKARELIDRGPYTARAAVAAGLIDRIAYADQLPELFKSALKAESVKIVRNYARAKSEELDLSNPFAIFKLLAPPKPVTSKKPKIAVIYAVGAIVTGRGVENPLLGSMVGSTTLIEAIRQAEEDATVKAIVLRVDSPGGSALASDLIWNELNRCRKPVVASMSDVAASGGYYISMAARKIFAEPGTLTGSIGVVGGKLVTRGLEDKLGLKTEVISRGANANILAADAPFSDSERQAMTALMKDVYEQFLDKALAGRKKAGKTMTRAELEALAGGRVWTGRQAKANGLIDELGTLGDAVAAAKELAGIEKTAELEILELPKARTFLDALIESRADAEAPSLGWQRTLGGTLPELAEAWQATHGLLRLRGEPVWALLPYRLKVR
ncbi:MAG: signal peptide peptidase SppA [Gemmataceae bacterium]|nr:signal peptide peptidase SppA [Gemmataceae bacterium]MDW8263783.1 signal peptide peptidase SppA [Gemmataceae bacterium]